MKKLILFIAGMVCAMLSVQAQQTTLHTISGMVLSAKEGTPLVGATVKVKNTNIGTITDAEGYFSLELTVLPDTLIISRIGFQEVQTVIRSSSENPLVIKLEPANTQLQGITVSTGYQQIPKERATGSFDFINNQLLTRNTSPNILDHIENLTPGLLFNHGDAANTDKFLIRGRSTIYANAQPLIVLNNFPYDGNINNINPDDIESITILKDAAAASIWGARAGNGVIVITTKKGTTVKPKVEFNSTITFSQKPDLYNIHTISSSDYIDLEKYLFSKGYYKYVLASGSHPPVTPVVELLNEEAKGLIPEEQADAEIASFKKNNALRDIGQYLYRKSLVQQYDMNVSGNTPKMNYYMSAGWARSFPSLVGTQSDRITLRAQNNFKISEKLQIEAGINYVQNISRNGNNPGYNLSSGAGKRLYPYASLVDQKGNPVSIVRDYRKTWADTVGDGSLLNWDYNPIQDISNENNILNTGDYTVDAGINYKINDWLQAKIKYQYENQQVTGNDFHNGESYFTRNLINQFTQVDPVTSILTYPVPMGGILDKSNTGIISHQGRIQLDYNRSWHNSMHQVAAIAGWEIKGMATSGYHDRLYGYNPDQSTVETSMDYVTFFSLYNNPVMQSQVTNWQYISKLTDRFISYFSNASYTYRNRYIVSASGRIDEANLFGVRTNQKGVPLWSAGTAWIVSNEPFFNLHWLPLLKFRLTYGHSGNISRLASAYTTATLYGANTTPAVEATIVGPPNKNLTWEQVAMTNIGVDFIVKNKILYGSVAYYQKKATNLMGEAPIDPTLGLTDNSGNSFYYGNVAGMSGNGIDIELNSHILDKSFKWFSTLIFSYAASKVTQYNMPVSNIGNAYLSVGINYINPVKGKPVFAYYSYPWAGLDPATGDPQGYIDGKISKDYSQIISNTSLQDMIYNGPAEPEYFGAIRNDFMWKNFSLSFNISYKFGYYFRRPSINYASLFSSWSGSSDYAKRWQSPGDEKWTNVPSIVYPANPNRDQFYNYSAVLVDNAGNIRLEDINLGYEINRNTLKKLPFEQIRFYIYASNLGILWMANKDGIDPYYVNIPKDRESLSLGVNIRF